MLRCGLIVSVCPHHTTPLSFGPPEMTHRVAYLLHDVDRRSITGAGLALSSSRVGYCEIMPTPSSEPQLIRQVPGDFARLLPADWIVTRSMPSRAVRGDLVVNVVAPDGHEVEFIVEAKRNLIPRDVPRVLSQMRLLRERTGLHSAELVIVAPYLSETARTLIEANGASYLDSTGNVLLRARQPALFIKLAGASKDPWPSDEALRSLKGRGTARAVRALLDFAPPYGVRELATLATVPLASMSRTVELLDRDGLINRAVRGPIVDIDWRGVLRRWAKDYDVESSNRVSTYLDPRGLSVLSAKLSKLRQGYAATGALAAQRFSPIAPTRLAAVYVDDVVEWSERLGLTPATEGANVWLIEPYDDVVFERVVRRDDITCVSPSQLAVDLLTGPGRDPSEGEELLVWMEGNQDAWRIR
jgi:hypothetical protein